MCGSERRGKRKMKDKWEKSKINIFKQRDRGGEEKERDREMRMKYDVGKRRKKTGGNVKQYIYIYIYIYVKNSIFGTSIYPYRSSVYIVFTYSISTYRRIYFLFFPYIYISLSLTLCPPLSVYLSRQIDDNISRKLYLMLTM